MKYVVLAGRVLFAFLFLLSAPGHFKPETIAFAEAQGVPLASVAVPLSGIVELLGGLSILVGYKTKYGAWLLVLFLVPVTFTMHRFWNITDPMMQRIDMVMFMKNISLIGTSLLLAYFGAGPLSVDAWLARKGRRQQVAYGAAPAVS